MDTRAPWIARSGWAWWAVGTTAGTYLAALSLSTEPVVLLPAAAALGIALILVATVAPFAAVSCFIFLCAVAGLWLSSAGFDFGIRVYVLDPLIAVLLGAFFVGSLVAPQRWNLRWPARGLFILLLSYLLLSTVHGLLAGHEARQVLGDFRRMAVYPLILFVMTAAVRDRRDVRVLLKVLVAAAFTTTLIEIVRIARGVGYAEAELAGTTVRYLSYVEASTAAVGLLILMGYSRTVRGLSRVMAVVGVTVLAATVLFANYRTVWVATAGGLIVQALSSGVRRGLKLTVGAFAGLVPVVYLLATNTELGKFVVDRFDIANVGASGLWRFYSWRAALNRWLDTPLFGTGLGYDHQFRYVSLASGDFVAATHNTVHNDPLWFLVNNGLLGALIGCLFLVIWARLALRLAQDALPMNRVVGSSALGAISLMILVSMLQPFFSIGAVVVLTCTLLVIVLRLDPTPAPQTLA